MPVLLATVFAGATIFGLSHLPMHFAPHPAAGRAARMEIDLPALPMLARDLAPWRDVDALGETPWGLETVSNTRWVASIPNEQDASRDELNLPGVCLTKKETADPYIPNPLARMLLEEVVRKMGAVAVTSTARPWTDSDASGLVIHGELSGDLRGPRDEPWRHWLQ